MRHVEDVCSRFDDKSALRSLCRTSGELVAVPPVLYHALRIAREVAEMTGGVFDPTIGARLEQLGFNRHYLTGEDASSGIVPDPRASYQDLTLVEDEDGLKIRLERPLLLDLGAVAKGLAVDLAAQELARFPGFAIDAGGDVYVGGVDPEEHLWRVGIEDPANPERLMRQVALTGAAVCTSGSYRRRSPRDPSSHHLVDPATGDSAVGLLSCTVIGPTAVLADVTATAAFLLGSERGLAFIDEMGLAGFMVTERHEVLETPAMGEFHHE
jgi:thiamine biosynthesis lipoprotein